MTKRWNFLKKRVEILIKLNDVKYKDCEGNIFKSKNYGDFKILNYNNRNSVYIMFVDTGYCCTVQMGDIRRGSVKDRLAPSVYGVGVVGTRYKTHILINDKNVVVDQYRLWRGILERSYSIKSKRKYPAYKDCTVSENFKQYEYFYEWCNRQIGFGNQGWQLDKDLLVKGNKVYSEDNCVFLPRELNNILTKREAFRGDYPIGVSYYKATGLFKSSVSLNGFLKCLGYYETPEEAFLVYKKAKEEFIKEQANKWKDQIDPRAFDALMNYEVDIND